MVTREQRLRKQTIAKGQAPARFWLLVRIAIRR
jgi:hypothetical protein